MPRPAGVTSAAAIAVASVMLLGGCTAGKSRPVGSPPSATELRSLLGANADAADDVAHGRAVVMINVTPLVTDSAPTPGPDDMSKMTIVAACVLSKRSGGPDGFGIGVMPTAQVMSAVRATAEQGGYRSLLGSNCAGDD